MDVAYELVVLVHLLGMASLVGGWLVQVSARGERYVSAAMLHGGLTQLVTGVALVAMAEGVASLDEPIDWPKMAVKLAVTLVVVVLCWANRRRHTLPDGVYAIIGMLAIGNVAVAVLWN